MLEQITNGTTIIANVIVIVTAIITTIITLRK